MTLARRLYAVRAFHVLILLAALALTGYTVSVLGVDNLVNPEVWWQSIVVWFAVAIIAHDLILFPLYALADRVLDLRRSPPAERVTARPPATNYVRLPTLASGLLFVVFFPGIIEQGAAAYQTATGLTQAPFLSRWLAITAVLYLAAALWYAVTTFVTMRRSA